jgi:spore maturation protein B
LELFRDLMDTCSQWMIPLVILLIITWAAVKRVPMYESFVTGAKEGFDVAVMIIPYLVAILLVIKVFIASGLFGDMKLAGVWMMTQMGMEEYAESLDLLPLALTRPLSGGGARGVLVDLFDTHGPDSFLGLTGSLLMGSTETTFYVLSVYFGAVQIKKIRHTLPACLIADCAGIIAAVVLGYILFGGSQ